MNKIRLLVVILCASLLASLAGCSQPTPAPTPSDPTETLTATVTLTPSPTPEPNATPSPTATPISAPLVYENYAGKIGVDLGGVNDRGLEFINMALTLRPWEKINADSCGEDDQACRLAPLDENGWPTTDARTVFFDLRPFGAWWGYDQQNCPLCADGRFQIDVSGIYRLSFTGKAELTSAEGQTEIQNLAYDPTANTTTADIIVGTGQGLVFLNFINTQRTAADPVGTGITNVRFIRPGFDPNTVEIINPAFIEALEPFKILRFMNWTGGNDLGNSFDAEGSPVTLDWADRTKPGELQTQREGVAWEYIIEVANLAKKDIWINIPIHASDDYITNLASLLKENLHPNAVIYIEYSNEVWNFLFSQAKWNQMMAEMEVKAGNSPLNNDGRTDPEVWRLRRHVKRLVEISNIFKGEFGSEAINNQVRVIHSWQIVQPQQYETQLNWVLDTYGPPSQFFYAVGGAGYFNIPADFPVDANTNVILGALLKSSDDSIKTRVDLKEVAKNFGLQLVFYEGGPDTAGPLQWQRNTVLLENCITAHRDPRMGDLIIHDMVNNWFAHPKIQGDVFIYFTLQSAFSRWGMWGLTEDINNLQTGKYQALAYLAGTVKMAPPTPLNLTMLPGEGEVTLRWDSAYGAEYYLVKRKTAIGQYETIAQIADTTFTDAGLENIKSYFYVISAVNANGESPDTFPMSAAYRLPPTPTPTPEIIPQDVVATSTAPVIDGQVDDAWSAAIPINITNAITGEVSGSEDVSAKLFLLWDVEYLYGLFQVTDDQLYNVAGFNPWDNDSVEIYLDGGNDKTSSYDINDEQFVFNYDSDQVWAQRGRGSDVVYASVKSDTGYTIEFRIPWTNVRVSAKSGRMIGFDAHVNDDDDGSGRQGKIALWAKSDQSWTDPSTFFTIVLK